MFWCNFLHFYQPPNQTEKILRKVTEESYRKILEGLWRYPNAKLTLNVVGCLTELLAKYGYSDILGLIKKLMERGQIEISECAMYHPFLPLLPETEIIRQIQLNHAINQKYFGPAYQPKGFFSPEMAYTRKLAEIVDRLGYRWMIIDEAAFPGNAPDPTKTYRVKGLNLKIYFRERAMSFKILSSQLGTGSLLLKDLNERLPRKEYLLTAMDGETFGHHRLGLEELLFDIYRSQELPTVTVSQLIKLFPETVEVEPAPSSWALMHKDQTKKEPMTRWYSPNNDIHLLQWSLTNLALELIQTADQTRPDFADARHLLDFALHSDQYWWASAKPWWSLEMIERGANDFIEAVNAMPGIATEQKHKAKLLYLEIITTGFKWQRTGVVEALVQEHYDEEVSQRLDLSVPLATEAEFQKIITHLNSQMLAAAKAGEYERAAQFKRRIAELKAERAQADTVKQKAKPINPPGRSEEKDELDPEWGN